MTEFAARVSRVRLKAGADVRIIEPRGNNVPERLRAMASEIERGEHGEVGSIVAVVEGTNGIDVRGWGNIDGLRAVGVLNLGMQQLTSSVINHFDGDAA